MTEQTFTPLNPLFIGKFPVYKRDARLSTMESVDDLKDLNNMYIVDLARGLCTCKHGAPFVDLGDKIVPASYCVHKIKALSKIVVKDSSLIPDYIKIVALRSNPYEVVSAFHKELRRGDYNKAMYWGAILSYYRGIKGVIKYMLNILYEETRDHELGKILLTEWRMSQGTPRYESMLKCIALFCVAAKKWELDHRFAIFKIEMKAYRELADRFGYDVAKAKEIIPAEYVPELTKTMLKGFAEGDQLKVQIGLKGLFKSKAACDHNVHKDYIFGLLEKVATGRYKNAFQAGSATTLINFLKQRRTELNEHGYHELNVLADLLCGEPYEAGIMSRDWRTKVLTASYSITDFPLGVVRQVPLYAHDNHTWAGKAYLKKYAYELGHGVPQNNIDFRWCGAYLGVAYRYQAYQQFQEIEVKWEAVKWDAMLHRFVLKLFY